MREQYMLGKQIALKYHEIFDHPFQLNELWVRATGFNRTIQSASSHLSGTFDEFKAKPLDFKPNDPKILPFHKYDSFNISSLNFNTS